MMLLRSIGTLKSILVRTVAIDAARRILDQRLTGVATVFLLHRAAGVYEGVNGYDPDKLEQLLIEINRRRYCLVTVQQIVDAARGNETLQGGAVAFTIDDGYRDQLEVLAPIFIKYQVPVTIFLTTGLINSELWPWDAKINWLIQNTRKSTIEIRLGHSRLRWSLSNRSEHISTRRELQAIGATLHADDLTEFIYSLEVAAEQDIPEISPPEFAGSNWELVRHLEHEGIRFAPHTHTHRILSRLSIDEARFELEHSLNTVMKETKHGLPILAYPLGKGQHFGVREMSLAKSVGYHGAFVVCEDGARWGDALGNPELSFRLGRYGLPVLQSEVLWLTSGLGVVREAKISSGAGQFCNINKNRRILNINWPIKFKHKTMIRRLLGRIKLQVGRYEVLRNINMDHVERFVFVCRGNVCRSPYAEAVAKSLGFQAISCGVSVTTSAPAETMAVRAAFLRGRDISRHLSRSIFDVSLTKTDCLVVMDPSQLPVAQKLAIAARCQVTLIGLWLNPCKVEIFDPYGSTLFNFNKCFTEIDDSMINLVRVLRKSDC